MIPGIPSSGGYFPQSPVNRARSAPAHTPAAPAPETHPETQPAEAHAPEGTSESLSRELNLFELAIRQFAEVLPRIELATVPVL